MFENVYKILKRVPKGKVATYGQIAKVLKIENCKLKINPKIVGWALHANKDLSVPCHRVVAKDGRLAPGYAFGGPDKQREKLLKEGVIFKDEKHVDLTKSFLLLYK